MGRGMGYLLTVPIGQSKLRTCYGIHEKPDGVGGEGEGGECVWEQGMGGSPMEYGMYCVYPKVQWSTICVLCTLLVDRAHRRVKAANLMWYT